jgi:drug/metabolite transporter (DMT)-like permease
MAAMLFSEPISMTMATGILATAIGVALVVRPASKRRETK